jgi:hypothetical protein
LLTFEKKSPAALCILKVALPVSLLAATCSALSEGVAPRKRLGVMLSSVGEAALFFDGGDGMLRCCLTESYCGSAVVQRKLGKK